MIRLKIIIFFCFVCFQSTNAQDNYPILSEIVTDNAKLFSESELIQLRQKLTAYETKTTHQIVVLTITSLGNDTVENYAYKVFNLEENKFGQEAEDNGILIAKNDRKFRIEVGDGLTPIITDALASRIIRNIMVPEFKEGDFYKGVDFGTSEIIKSIDNPIYANEFLNSNQGSTHDSSGEVSIITKIISSLFLAGVFFLIGFFGYNKLFIKEKRKKIKLGKFYKKNKTQFLVLFALGVCFIFYFNAFFLRLFFGLFLVSFLSVFVWIGLFVLLKLAYKRAILLFTHLFTGKLGIINLFFYLPILFLLVLASFMFSFIPIIMGLFSITQIIFKRDLNDVMSNVEPIYLLYFIIAVFVSFYIISIIMAIKKIRKSRKHIFRVVFFKMGKGLSMNSGSGSGSSRSYSSSGSSSYSSSSSSSSFSGGGGSSSGGGASGSW